jgi:orotate phosphoribosyltransferase
VIFYYAIFPESEKILADLNVQLHRLATWWDVLAVAKKYQYFDANTLAEVEKFLNHPGEWSASHGGVATFPKTE